MATATVTAAGLPQAFVLPYADTKKQHYSPVSEFFRTKMKDVVKGFAYATGWTAMGLGKEHSVGKVAGDFSAFATNTKNFLGAIEIPSKTYDLAVATEDFIKDPSIGTASELFLGKASALTSSVCDSIDLTSKFVHIPSDAFKAVKGVNFAATFVGSAYDAVKQIHQIATDDKLDAKKTTLRLIHIARDVSYIVLAVLGFIGVLLGVSFPPAIFLACLTSGLVFGIAGFFFERLAVNPAPEDISKVRTNFNAVSEHLRRLQATPAA